MMAGPIVFTKTVPTPSPPVASLATSVAGASTRKSADFPTEPHEDAPRVVAGYTLHEPLGGGGYGEVWRGTAPGGLPKAVKILHGRLDGPHADVELRALERLRDVRHPFLLSVERIELCDGKVVIVTELAERSLEDCFAEHREAGLRGVPREELLAYLRDAADALDFLRERHGLQHLDVKPGNLLIQAGHAKVGDFGLVKDLGQIDVSQVSGFTPLYAPPELLEGRPHENSDQYSLAVLYQTMLTGVPPFAGRTAAHLAAQHLSSPPDLTSLPACDRPAVSRALSKNPRTRFKTCRAFIDDLAAGGSGRGERVPSAPRRTADPESRPGRAAERPAAAGGASRKPARPLPPVVAPTSVEYRPTVFLGLGGFGGQVLLGVRRRLAERPSGHCLPPFAFLYADTDRHAVAAARFEGLAGGDADALEIPLRGAEDYRRASGRYLDWLNRRWLFNIPKSGEVEGIRPLGRLAFVDHQEKLRGRIRSLIAAAAGGCQDPAGGIPAVDVVLVASASGGTGSGCVLGTGYLVREVLKDLGFAGRVTAVLGCGSPAPIGQHDAPRANTLALLKEIARYDESGGGFPGDAACRLPKSAGLPFDDAYLVRAGGSATAEEEQVAEYLYRATATPARGLYQACRPETGRAREGEGFTLRTFAVSTEGAGSGTAGDVDGLCRATLDYWLDRDAAGGDAAVKTARTLLAEAGVTAGQIVASVTAKLDADLAAVVPGALRAAEGHSRFVDATRVIDRFFDGSDDASARPESLRRFDAEVAQGIARAGDLIAGRLIGDDPAAAVALETAREVVSGLDEVERVVARLVGEIIRERCQVEQGVPTGFLRRPDPAALRAAVSQYATLRLCEIAYRRWLEGIAGLRDDVATLGERVARIRPALAALRVEWLETGEGSGRDEGTSPFAGTGVVSEFASELRSRDALPWDELMTGDPIRFRAGLRAAVERFLKGATAAGPSEDIPRPGLENVGGFYRILATHPTLAAIRPGDGVVSVCDPANPPFRCCEVERIRLADAFAAIADGDEWAVAAAARLHVREDVNWGGLG